MYHEKERNHMDQNLTVYFYCMFDLIDEGVIEYYYKLPVVIKYTFYGLGMDANFLANICKIMNLLRKCRRYHCYFFKTVSRAVK